MKEPQDLPPLPKPPEISREDRRKAFRWFFFAVFALLIYQLLRLFSLFADPMIWAATLALIFYPVHQFFARRFSKNALTACLSASCVILLCVIPLMLLGWVVLSQSSRLLPTVSDWMAQLKALEGRSLESLLPSALRGGWSRLSALLGAYDLDAQTTFLNGLNAVSSAIAELGASAAKNAMLVLFNLAIVVLGLFFCFKDGEAFVRWFLDLIPMPHDQTWAIAIRVYQTLTAVVRGALLTAAVQGTLAGVGYAIAGVPLAVLFGVLTGFASLIPVAGAALVWLPLGLVKLGENGAWGVFILAWGFFVVSLIDNFLKPILIGTRAKMPILLIFFGVLGGLRIYGFTGLILGPILIACVLAFVKIYREEYHPPQPPGPQ